MPRNDLRFARRDDVALERFPDAVVAFQATDCQLVTLNATSAAIWDMLDGTRTLEDIASALASQYDPAPDTLRIDAAAALGTMERQRLVKPVATALSTNRKDNMNPTPRYLANPDVLCRIEDESGAILFNPDTDAVQVINSIGLEIWQTLSTPRTHADLVAHLREVCEEVPADQVEKDVEAFIKPLLGTGFVGETEAGHGG